MLAVERRNQIEDIIQKNKSVMVLELAKKFDVTTETIRGDLEKLEKQGVLVRTYGGATLVEGSLSDIPLSDREVINFEGKQRIGKRASKLIKDGETVFLDASTSSLHIARNIKDKKSLTVITNSERIVNELAVCENIRVISTGGLLTVKNMSYIGRIVEKTLRENYFANKVFFSCRGVTVARGLTESNEAEAEIKKAMIECSESAVFLCDHTKIGKIGVPVISYFDRIDTVITDEKMTDEWRNCLAENDVNLIEEL
ncbi:MAG: DeoR/GlpR family DNA-binding transcription regulator [Clostridiales bacterium]|nr:DeoR/GlpR family DNA-binding transcription regulator [Clostridiales bacterium]